MFFRRVFNHEKDTYPSPNSQPLDANGNVSDNSETSSDVRVSTSAVDKTSTSAVVRSHRSYADERVNNNRVFNVIQLTPLWEHVIRTGHLPDELNVTDLFDEFTERLNDPEWQVRQHALRVLVDVLIILGPKADAYFAPLVAPLVDNLGHAAPAVRKGALDALRVYIGESRLPENVLYDVIDLGINGNSESLYGGRLTVGVMLSLPALIQVTLTHPKRRLLIRAAINSLLSKIGEISYQEIALKILLRLKDLIGHTEFYEYIPNNSLQDFNVLCDVYGLNKNSMGVDRGSLNSHRDSGIGVSLPSSGESSQSWTKISDVAINKIVQGSNRPATVTVLQDSSQKEDSNTLDSEIRWKINKSCDGNKSEEPRCGTANSQRNESSSSCGNESNCPLTHVPECDLPPGKVIMETEIQLNEATAVTMRILEADSSNDQDIEIVSEGSEEESVDRHKSAAQAETTTTTTTTESMKTSQTMSYDGFDDNLDSNRRSTPKRVHFGGEVIKIRTPDSESVAQSDDDHIRPITHPTMQSPVRAVNRESLAVSQVFVNEAREASKASSTSSLSIEIPQDNTKPLAVLRERPKTTSSTRGMSRNASITPPPSSMRTTSFAPSDSATAATMSGPMSPGSNRTKSASPRHRRRLSLGSRLDLITSPKGPHTAMEILYNLQRSPLVSPVKPSSATASTTGARERMDGTSGQQNNLYKSPAEDGNLGRGASGIGYENESRKESGSKETVASSSWEDLEIVSRDVIQGLKSGDWTQRSAAFCQLEQFLMDTDNFANVQPCLESLLRTLLSSEKHCDVADDKKRILINTISRLPLETVENRTNQILIGLCRQGGPNANQMALAMMQRMPAAAIVGKLLSEEFLHARSSRFRENALQIVLYALMTFPSTYFDVSSCVSRTVLTALDRKKRVRQAALDVLAVLGQISSPKVVVDVAQAVTVNRQDGDKLCNAIKARLSRKQLPMIRADDSVQYGLRLPNSHNFSVFGADIEWITNGIGSVSPKSLKARVYNPLYNTGGGGSSSTTTTESELDSPSGIGVGGGGVKSSIPSLTGQLKFGKSHANSSNHHQGFHSSFPNLSGHQGGGFINMGAEGSGGLTAIGFKNRDSGTFEAKRSFKRGRFVEEDNIVCDESAGADKKRDMLVVSSVPLHNRSPPATTSTSRGREKEDSWGQRQAKSQSFPELNGGVLIVNANGNAAMDRNNGKAKAFNGWRGEGTPPSTRMHNNQLNISRLRSVENNTFGERICGNQGHDDLEEREDDDEEEEERDDEERRKELEGKYGSAQMTRNENGARENLSRQTSPRESNRPMAHSQSVQTTLRFSSPDEYEGSPKGKSADHKRSNEDNDGEKVSTPMAAAMKSAYSYKSSLHSINLAAENQPSTGSDEPAAFDVIQEANITSHRSREENQEVTSELSTTSTATGSSNSSTQQNNATGNSSALSIANRLNNLQNYDEDQVKGLSRTLSVQTLPMINTSLERSAPEGRPKTSISLNASIPFDEIPIKTRYSSTVSLAKIANESGSSTYDEVDRQLTLEKSLTAFDLKPRLNHLDDAAKNVSISLNANLDAAESFKPEPHRPLHRNVADLVKSPKNYLRRGVERKIFPVKLASQGHSPMKGKYKEENSSSIGPILGSFERPKEAYLNCVAQLEDANWETVMIGLKNFIRLIRHHPEYIDPHIHVMAGIMAKHVRNLRSQVSRAACQATEEFFSTHRKLLETEADDLVTTLLSRTADTNRFLRKDATQALESMCDNLSTQKVIQLLSTRGVTHQNALVRTTTSYLLCRLVANLGADKVYANRDSRDRVFITSAQLLTEGSLETRNYAKQLFRMLSTNIKYQKVLLEVIPNKLYRHIEKTLKKV